jgi:hypothetical protein
MGQAKVVLLAAGAIACCGTGVALASGGAPAPQPPDPPPYTLVASGSASAKVAAPFRETNASVERVVSDARAAAMPAAVAAARRDAAALGAAGGLVPGAVVSLRRDTSPPGWWNGDDGAFGPARWCGRIFTGRRTVLRPDGTTKRVNRYRDGCRPPKEISVRVTVTFAARP